VHTIGVEMKLQHIEKLDRFSKYEDLACAVFSPFPK
jgi:hypothetical protein